MFSQQDHCRLEPFWICESSWVPSHPGTRAVLGRYLRNTVVMASRLPEHRLGATFQEHSEKLGRPHNRHNSPRAIRGSILRILSYILTPDLHWLWSTLPNEAFCVHHLVFAPCVMFGGLENLGGGGGRSTEDGPKPVWMLGRGLKLTREHLAVAPCRRLTQFLYH